MTCLILSALLALPGMARGQALFSESFAKRGIVASPQVPSSLWQAESGEVLSRGGTGWTRSPALRLFTRRRDFHNAAVSFDFLNRGLTPGHKAGAEVWDGLHVWLRHQSDASHYEVSVNRRDDTVVISKKGPGASGPELHTLSGYASYPIPFNSWQSIRVTISDNADGSVAISLYAGEALLVNAVDNGTVGGPAIRGPGRVGLRGANAHLNLARFEIKALGIETVASRRPTVGDFRATEAIVRWTTETESQAEIEYGLTAEYGSAATGAPGQEHAVTLTGLKPATLYHYRLLGRDAAGAPAPGPDLTFTTPSTLDLMAPSLSIAAPAPGAVVSGIVTLAAAVFDDTRVASVQFLLDGSPIGEALSTAPYRASWDTTQFANGAHTLVATARDAVGNQNESSLTLTIANVERGVDTNSTQPAQALVGTSAWPAGVGEASPGAGSQAGSGVSDASADRARAVEKFLSPALADGINDRATFGAEAAEVDIFDLRGRRIFQSRRQGGGILSWNGRDSFGRLVESGVYIAKIIRGDLRIVYQSFAVVK